MPTTDVVRPGVLSARGRQQLAEWALAHPVRTVLLAYAGSRVVSLLALLIAARWFQNPAGVGHFEPGVGDLIPLWDSVWYERIANDGYPVPLPVDPETGRVTYSAWAFYPLFPGLVRPFMALGLPFTAVASTINLLLGGAGAVAIWAVLRSGVHADAQAQRDRLALVAACLWCFYPATSVLLKPYTEGLAILLIALALLLLVHRRYAGVAVVALLLGFTRGVAPALGVAVLIHLVLRWREDQADGLPPLAGQRRSATAMVLALGVAAVAWPVVAAVATGRPTAFFDVQAAWGMRPESGPFVLWLTWAWESKGVAGVIVLVALVGTYLALVLGRHGRWIPLEARAWALAYPLYLFAVVRPITSMWRFLLLDFPIAALVASVSMRTATGATVVPHWRRRVGVVVVVLALGIVWWTASFLVYTPWGSHPP